MTREGRGGGAVPRTPRAKRLFAEAYDASAAGFARSADRLVYAYLARPLARALAGAGGPVLDVAAGSGALGRLLPVAVALDLSAAQLRHNPLGARLQGDAERLPFRDDSFAAAGCAFGINHFPDPAAALAEMARVAPLVGVLTWARPEPPYRPKQAVMEVVARHAGSDRTAAGVLADELGERVGSPAAVRELLDGAGLRPDVAEVAVDLPWPGAAAFVDYRLATVGVAGLVDDPAAAVAEMARVAPLVGVLTWARPEPPYHPKQAVMEVVARHAGSDRTAAGVLVDQLGERVGSPAAVRELLDGAGLHSHVAEVAIDLPWPGAAAFVDYRLATVGVAGLVEDPATVRREAIAAVAALPPETLPWTPRLVLGTGSRQDG